MSGRLVSHLTDCAPQSYRCHPIRLTSRGGEACAFRFEKASRKIGARLADLGATTCTCTCAWHSSSSPPSLCLHVMIWRPTVCCKNVHNAPGNAGKLTQLKKLQTASTYLFMAVGQESELQPAFNCSPRAVNAVKLIRCLLPTERFPCATFALRTRNCVDDVYLELRSYS